MHPIAHLALLAIVCVAVFSNNFHHEFLLDDSHAIQANLSVRSLANIPAFFTDAGLFSTLRANVDYRPVLLVTYALNFALGGLDTTWWHATQIVLHLVVALALYALTRRVLVLRNGGPVDARTYAVVPLLTALIFAVHPTGSGVVNYLSARSSLLTAAFLLPSIVLYLRVPSVDDRRIPWLSAALFALALWTKIEAIAALAVYFLYEAWMRSAAARPHGLSFPRSVFLACDRRTIRRIVPFLTIAAIYIVVRAKVMAGFAFDETRRASGVSALDYLLTQVVVWWEYVSKWFVPVGLVADNGIHPVYRSVLDAPVIAALTGWVIVAALVLRTWRTQPWFGFIVIAALALISPTSSIAPLAEMINEHRPYLPLAVLSLAWTIPLGSFVARERSSQPRTRMTLSMICVVLIAAAGVAMWQRNRAFSTNRAYLDDINRKAPSHRSLMNYGLILMGEGKYESALTYFNQALELAPYWHFLHTNLGIVYRERGDLAAARRHFDLAVQYDPYSGIALRWRGEHFLFLRDYVSAKRDFEAARQVSLQHYEIARGMATALAGLGDVEGALRETRECLRLDPSRTGIDIVSISNPYFQSPLLTSAGLRYFEALEVNLPEAWWIPANIATLAERLGDVPRAATARARADRLRQ